MITIGRIALLEESVEIGRRGGDQWLFSIALNNLGDQLMGEGEYERAIECTKPPRASLTRSARH